MKSPQIRIIINPGAGKNIPILNTLNDELQALKITWDVVITHSSGDATTYARQAVSEGISTVGVYGGDGTVMEVAEGLAGTDIPMVILPGGTANVLAKELGVPIELDMAIRSIARSRNIRTIDMFEVNSKPHLIRMNFGFFADFVVETDRTLKDMLGMFAYNLSMVRAFSNAQELTYRISADGIESEIRAVGMIIGNAGNMGVPGLSFTRKMKIDDGKLDLIVLRDKSLHSIAQITGGIFAEDDTTDVEYLNLQFREATISSNRKQRVVLDDREFVLEKDTPMNIRVIPQSLKVYVP